MRNLFPLTLALLLLAGCGGGDEPSAPTPGISATDAGADELDHPSMTPVDVSFDDPAALEEALGRNPGHAPILMRMAELALQNGDAEQAVVHLREAVAAEPGDLDVRLELGRAMYESGDAAGAMSETEAILEIDPNHVDALYNLGAIHANQKRQPQAIEYWTRAVGVAPGSPSGRNAQRGLDLLSGRQPSVAAMPDIPEHRGLTSDTAPQSTRIDPGTRDRIIDFAFEANPE